MRALEQFSELTVSREVGWIPLYSFLEYQVFCSYLQLPMIYVPPMFGRPLNNGIRSCNCKLLIVFVIFE